jgi:hypothetical protein
VYLLGLPAIHIKERRQTGVLENRIFGRKRKQVVGEYRKLRAENLYNLYSEIVTRVIR